MNEIKFTNLSQIEALAEGNIIKYFHSNGIEIGFYGGELCSVEIDGEDIEDILNIPEGDAELENRISSEDIRYILEELNKRTAR